LARRPEIGLRCVLQGGRVRVCGLAGGERIPSGPSRRRVFVLNDD